MVPNRNNRRQSEFVSTTTNYPGGGQSVTRYQSASQIDYLSSSGYYGKRPRPLQPHAFTYTVAQAGGQSVYRTWYYGYSSQLISDVISEGPNLSASQTGFSIPNLAAYDSIVYNEALSRLNDRVRGGLDLSVDIAESGQVVGMLNGAKRIGYLADAVKRKYRIVKFTADAFLEFTYGMKPLVSSIFGCANNILDQSLNFGPKNDRFVGSAAADFDPGYFQLLLRDGYHSFPSRSKVKNRCRIALTLKSSDRFDVAKWTSLNPVSIAWELLPYSFVVDWFIDISGYLRNLETGFVYGDRFVNGFVSRLKAYDESSEWEWKGGNWNSYWNTYRSLFNDKYWLRYLQFDRSLLNSYPFPHPPKVNVNLGTSRLFSAASLLAQKLR